MTAWLTDTLIYTGVLIALVLVLRRPVARAFGPQMAYALWALPLLRFVMPPIVLPSSLAPVAAPAAELVAPVPSGAEVLNPAEMMLAGVPASDAIAPLPPEAIVPPAEPAAADFSWMFDTGLLFDAVFTLWLIGAAVFLAWRVRTYLDMRKDLLAGSRPVGEAGKVRLVETPAVSGPIAFGVLDRVVALPMEFMAWGDRAARDLAIEHELAHHRGGDLLANMLAQPVLALHWFNPLAWMGWKAMRRDQEAACDARVMAWRAPHERAFYGEVIASFAAGPRLALAAPMACPMGVLGEKSIIHRLRSLNMSEISPRRRFAGRVLLTGAALAVPLTASISYAEAQVPPPWPAAPAEPAEPAAPAAPQAPRVPYDWMDHGKDIDVQVRHQDGKKIVTVTKAGKDGEGEPKVVRTYVVPEGQRTGWEQWQRPANMSDEQWEAEVERRSEIWERQSEEWARRGEEWARQAEENAAYWEKWGQDFAEKWQKEWPQAPQAAQMPQMPQMPQIAVPQFNFKFEFHCDRNGKPVRVQRNRDDADEGQSFEDCQQIAANANARRAIERARDSIAHDPRMSDEVRDEVIESLDREIERLSDDT
jgi:beta-lactamase regulating signal transducer with metallopeptidase domain